MIVVIFGFPGRVVIIGTLYVAPLLQLLLVYPWRNKSTSFERLTTLVLMTTLIWFGYGYFSGSYVPTTEIILLISVLVTPWLVGEVLIRLLTSKMKL